MTNPTVDAKCAMPLLPWNFPSTLCTLLQLQDSKRSLRQQRETDTHHRAQKPQTGAAFDCAIEDQH
jgi:hypothetical protein